MGADGGERLAQTLSAPVELELDDAVEFGSTGLDVGLLFAPLSPSSALSLLSFILSLLCFDASGMSKVDAVLLELLAARLDRPLADPGCVVPPVLSLQ